MSGRLSDDDLVILAAVGGETELLAREVQASRKLVADLRAWHHRFMANNEPGQPVPWCAGCNQPWPCPDIRKIDGAGL